MLYNRDYPDIRDKRTKLFEDLKLRIEDVRNRESDQARTLGWVGLAPILIILLAIPIVGRVHAATVTQPLNRLVAALERMRQGDFTERLAIERRDEFGILSEGFNRLADNLSELVGQVQRSGIQVNTTATEIAATAREQQSTAHEIAATTAQIGATSKQISATSKELVKTMNEVSQVAEQTADLAGSGQTAITRMETTMRQITEASGSITAKLAVLSEKTTNINSVVTTITKVADQTNLLSLNAAIEAEKAGEYGLGFAVVAMEIRRLADQTAVATYDIEKMVKEMQSAVAAGVMSMDKFSEEARRGVEEIRQVSTHLAQIIHQVQTFTPRFQTVNEGMHAQATGAQQISDTLTQLGEAAQQTADSLRQSNLAIEQLNSAARGLQASVARFKLST
jgi:methyl-accepting chemotaxis protein WspA